MKLGRDAFLYLDPKDPEGRFAQCSTCRDWVTDDRRCVIHGPKVYVAGRMSCGLYVHGQPQPKGTPTKVIVTAEESGLVDRQVRCENCQWFDVAGECGLYDLLNKRLKEFFDLDINVDAHGCCNAQQPEESA